MRRQKWISMSWKVLLAVLTMTCIISSSAWAYGIKKTVKVKGKTYTVTMNGGSPFRVYKGTQTTAKNRLYSKKQSGYGLSYRTVYGNKIYFDAINETGGIFPFVFSFDVSKKKLKNLGRFYTDSVSGRYAYGTKYFLSSGGFGDMRVLDLKTGKLKDLGVGIGLTRIGRKIYYLAPRKGNTKTYDVVRCNPNGSGRTIIRSVTLKGQILSLHFTSAHSFRYHTLSGKSGGYKKSF